MKTDFSSSITTATLLIATASAAVLVFAPQAKAQTATASVQQALIAQDNVALRSAPRDSGTQQAQLWQGELVEVRSEKLDYVQVWDYKRERGGYVKASQIRKVSFAPQEADNLLAVQRFVKDAPGSEGLTFAYGAAWFKAASATQTTSATGAEVLDAIGVAAERLARRASSAGLSKAVQDSTTGQLDAAQRYGVRFESFESDGKDSKVTLCYEGDAFARVLALPTATNEQRARAALAITRSDCEDPALALKKPAEFAKAQEWRAATLDKVQTAGVPTYLKYRLHMRRASVWSTLAYQRARAGLPTSTQAAQRALDELALVNKAELPDDDVALVNDSIMRVNASRWALAPLAPLTTAISNGLSIHTSAGSTPGETCVSLAQGKDQLAKRCTFGVAWPASFSADREANAAALAVQTQAAWREMWVFRKQAGQWNIDVLVPSDVNPELGYIELAGWVPGGTQMLVAREARGEGKYKRNYEVLELSNFSIHRQATDPNIIGAFQRWTQPQWKAQTVSLR